jgi:hypothetical protein
MLTQKASSRGGRGAAPPPRHNNVGQSTRRFKSQHPRALPPTRPSPSLSSLPPPPSPLLKLYRGGKRRSRMPSLIGAPAGGTGGGAKDSPAPVMHRQAACRQLKSRYKFWTPRLIRAQFTCFTAYKSTNTDAASAPHRLGRQRRKVRAFLRGPFYQAMTSGLDTENTVLLAYRRRIGMHVEAPKRVRDGVGGGRGGKKGGRDRVHT